MSAIKRFLTAVIFVLALNFLAVAGAGAYFWQSAGLNEEKLAALSDILFPAEEPVTGELEAPDEEAVPTALEQLESLLATDTTLPAPERVEAMDEAFTTRVEQLDRRLRELHDQRAQLRLAEENLLAKRQEIDQDTDALEQETTEAERLAEDSGFQDTLKLYAGMKPRQVKDIFMDLDDETVVQYLGAMDTRKANKILAEFKAPAEVVRVRDVLELMRQNAVAMTDEPEGTGS